MGRVWQHGHCLQQGGVPRDACVCPSRVVRLVIGASASSNILDKYGNSINLGAAAVKVTASSSAACILRLLVPRACAKVQMRAMGTVVHRVQG